LGRFTVAAGGHRGSKYKAPPSLRAGLMAEIGFWSRVIHIWRVLYAHKGSFFFKN
jgi:hypothetical protein